MPIYNHLRIFGCLCYATNTKPNKNKFEYRAFKWIFIGYASRYKAYKLYDLHNKKIIISRDVVLHEHVLPFHSGYTSQFDDIVLPNTELDTKSFHDSESEYIPVLSNENHT